MAKAALTQGPASAKDRQPELQFVAVAEKQPVSPTAIIGTSGLRHASGFIDEEYLARLKGRQGVQFYRQMLDGNSVIGAIMFVIKSLVRQVPWSVEAASDKPEAKRQQEFVEECYADMSHTFEDFISEALSFLGYGWSYFEQVYKIRRGDTADPTTRSDFTDGKIGLRKLEIRSQDTLWQWGFDRDGSLRGMIQLDTWNAMGRGPVFLPIEKCLLFRTETTKGNPEGRSLLRNAVRDYHYLTRIQETEAIGIERDLTGMPVFQVPKEILMPNANANDRALRGLLETMIQQIRVDERFGGLVPSEIDAATGKPSGFKFALTTTGGKRMIDTNEIVRRYESRIAMTFLSEFIMIGDTKVGTQSLFEGKSNLFGIALGTLLDIVASTLTRHCIHRLMRMNGVPREFWPNQSHGDITNPDLDKLGTFIQKLGAAGVLSPNSKLEKKALEMANLPPPEEADLAVFEDPSTPTPSDPADVASGLMSQEQVDTVLKINEAIAAKKLSRAAATKLLVHRLGMDPAQVGAFIEEDPEQTAQREAEQEARAQALASAPAPAAPPKKKADAPLPPPKE